MNENVASQVENAPPYKRNLRCGLRFNVDVKEFSRLLWIRVVTVSSKRQYVTLITPSQKFLKTRNNRQLSISILMQFRCRIQFQIFLPTNSRVFPPRLRQSPESRTSSMLVPPESN